jgi:excinuclease ABC subunit A
VNKRGLKPDQNYLQENQQFIELHGVSTNNLKGIDVKIPLHLLTVVTGVSGSGKSSLVFDTLYAEAYRRYVESLSSFARQYLKALPKPKVMAVKNLPPAIAVRQTRSGATNRSTVGTLTEMYDALRIIYSELGILKCIECGKDVVKADPDKIANIVIEQSFRTKVLVLAPLAAWDGVDADELKSMLIGQGFTRILASGKLVRLEDAKSIKRETSYVVVDRLAVDLGVKQRLSEASHLALKLGRGVAAIQDESGEIREFSRSLRCCGIDYIERSMALFSFNHPLGACETCQGFGSMAVIDRDKVIPDPSLSLSSKGVAPWNFGDHSVCYEEAFRGIAHLKLSLSLKKKPFSEFTKEEMEWLWKGDGKKFTGISGYFAWLDTKRYKPHFRIHAARFRKYVICDLCDGKRLNKKALAYQVNGLSLSEVTNKDVEELLIWIATINSSQKGSLTADGAGVAKEALEEAVTRLTYLSRMGLSYLSLNRAATTLSGGELQRISMSRCLGSVLTDTLFCLDEPTAGLHARDSKNLLSVIRDLQSFGNTVVVVEHEKTIIDDADHYIEIGPKSGHEGGFIVRSGKPATLEKREANWKSDVKEKDFQFIELQNASVNNLKNVSAVFPIGKVTAVCGVSGSGKTSLITHSFFPLLEQFFGDKLEGSSKKKVKDAGVIGPKHLISKHSDVLMVSQASLGRSSRSTIGTYLGVMDEIRKILAGTEQAKLKKLTPGSFSFNVSGGRCETCRGLGTVVEDLSFLGDMEIICPACNGRRFQDKVLGVLYNGKNLIDILSLTVAEARQFFFDKPVMVANLDAVLDVGMGYVTLGQHTSSFSGGEAQRLKLVQIMRDAKKGKPAILIFDEPTTGLSDADVSRLVDQFDRLAASGHTVIIVEHHLDVLRRADWLIEMGPEASAAGGEVVYQGVPAAIGSSKRSVTSQFLLPH